MNPLTQLDAAIATARERLEKLVAAREVMAEFGGTNHSASDARRSGGNNDRATPRPSQPIASPKERRLCLARHMLTAGEMSFADVARFLNVATDAANRTLSHSWFMKAGKAGTRSPWTLSSAGRAVVTRGGTPPTEEHAPPPAGEMRHNPDLDQAFGDGADLFMGGGSSGPKSQPPPFALNGTGAAHVNGTATMNPSCLRVLRALAAGPARFTTLCQQLNDVNTNTVNKWLNTLLSRGMVFKQEEAGHRGAWAITELGREEMAKS
jgi:predicted transcriptional regulator